MSIVIDRALLSTWRSIAVLALMLSPSLSPAWASQEGAYAVTVDGQATLRFSTTSRVQDVLVRRTTAPELALVFDVVGVAFKGKGNPRSCRGLLTVSNTTISFTSKEKKTLTTSDRNTFNSGDCRLMVAELNVPVTKIQSPRITSPLEEDVFLRFEQNDRLYGIYLAAEGSDKSFCSECEPPDYEFLLLALTAPDSALARFETVIANSVLPSSGSSPSPQKTSLYEDFFNRRRTDPDSAYSAAKVFLAAMKDQPSTPEVEFARQWVAAYEKVKGIQ